MRSVIAWAAAIVGGLLLWASFAPIAVPISAALGVALITLATHRVRPIVGLARGFAAGLAFLLPLLSWLHPVGRDAAIALAVYCALWFALLGWGISRVTRLRLWPLWVGAVWILQETVSGTLPFGGFAWGRLAYGQADAAPGQAAGVLGLSGVSFLVVLAGAALAAAVVQARVRHWPTVTAWLVVAALSWWAPALLHPVAPSNGTAVLAVVQGGTPQVGLGAMDVRRAVLENHVRETMTLARRVGAGQVPQPDLVVWPENSSDLDPFEDAEAASLITMAAQAVGAPILVGAIVDVPGNPDGVWNLGMLWDPVTGPGPRYAKRHPVPFGEYIPFRDVIAPLVGRLERIPRDFVAGTSAGLFDVGTMLVGDLICFEVAYDDVVLPLQHAGAQVLTVQTNNATYAGTSQPDQQLAITRMRALETGRSIAVAATTGVSAFINPDGSLQSSLGQGETGSLVATVPLRSDPLPSARLGAWVTMLLCGVGAVAVAIGTLAGRRARPSTVAS